MNLLSNVLKFTLGGGRSDAGARVYDGAGEVSVADTGHRHRGRRASFDTVRALVRHIEAYIAERNRHPTPVVWTKDPATIIKKAVRRGR